MKSPIFIFSMPRSGSTLLQRVLSSHELIGTTSEPWLLLPLIYSLKKQGALSEYSNANSSKAINDIIKNKANGKDIYFESINLFATNIYSKLLKEKELFFLDKTPRYYLIIEEIYQIFPNAKFIFLFRNPIHVYSSILKTWCNGNFLRLYGNHNDLTSGFEKLSTSFNKHKKDNNTIGLKYEDFVTYPIKTIEKILNFLEIEIDYDVADNFNNSSLSNNNTFLGDPTGIYQYKTISTESLNKWKKTFNTRIRKAILKKYIKNSLTNNTIETQGYSKKKLLKEIDQLNNKGKYNPFIDVIHYISYKLISRYNLYLLFGKRMSWIKNKFLS